MTACNHELDGPDDLPDFLCRRCHPELNATPEQRAAADAIDRDKRDAQMARERHERELRRAEAKLESLTKNGKATEGSVSGKIAESFRKKAEKLRAEVSI